MANKKKNKTREIVARASVRGVRISPQKARLIVNAIRGKQVETALQLLQQSEKKGSQIVLTLLQSAVANAAEKQSVDVDRLWVVGAAVDMGKSLRRPLPRARGRADWLRKPSSHISLQLGEGI